MLIQAIADSNMISVSLWGSSFFLLRQKWPHPLPFTYHICEISEFRTFAAKLEDSPYLDFVSTDYWWMSLYGLRNLVSQQLWCSIIKKKLARTIDCYLFLNRWEQMNVGGYTLFKEVKLTLAWKRLTCDDQSEFWEMSANDLKNLGSYSCLYKR